MALPLEVVADLQLAVDGEPISIEANGKRIIVDLASLEASSEARSTMIRFPFASMDMGSPSTASCRSATTSRGRAIRATS